MISIGIRVYAPDIRFNHLGVRSWLANLSFAFAHILFTLMDDPHMFDISKIDIWKVRMSWHLKSIGWQVYLVITKESYLGNDKHKRLMHKP